ncbi:MAG: beta-1,6-N-acetylglucosaminyltransferase [Paracoccus sp. (in: a-proteobacteria)]|nr:beta-1,6-N-acetylglucosaminyltransferase [Paracoccus sp. (in: a-proteobacteria)]
MSGQVRLGVILLCHAQLDTAAILARRWHDGGAAVAIHVDSKATEAEFTAMRESLADLGDVIFVPRKSCEWGMFSLVEVTQNAGEMLLERFGDVTHVFLSSGNCLLLRNVSDLTAYLARHRDRDFIESVNALDAGWTVGGLSIERFNLRFPFSWRAQRKLFDRFTTLQKRLGLRRRIPDGVVPHLGSQWWCLTRQTLQLILTDPRRAEFDRYFRHVWIPDESYFQTLARRHSTRIESRSLTLFKFDDQGKPYIFYDDHADMLAESRCFVARKVWVGATGLMARFPAALPDAPKDAEPRPARIERLINRAVARRKIGRPGLYMQSRFPLKDRENGKTAAVYGVFQGFTDLFPDFRDWLAARFPAADVHGHLFGPEGAEFAHRATEGPGGLSADRRTRDYDAQGFLTSLIRISDRMQMFQHAPRDNQALNWFMVTDPNARIHIVTGAWVVPLMNSGMPFDDVRRIAAKLQQVEMEQLEVLRSVWVKAQVWEWELADFLARPADIMQSILTHIAGADAGANAPLPAMREVAGVGAFLQELRNAGLHPRLMGDFSAQADGGLRE